MKKIIIILVVFLISCTPDEDMNQFIMATTSNSEEVVPNFSLSGFNIWLGLGDATKTAAIKTIIDYMDSDVVFLTEVDNTSWTTIQATYTDYSHFLKLSTSGTFQLAVMSKLPILYSEEIDMEGRKPLYIEVEVDGSRIGLSGVHNESWCTSLPCNTLPTELPAEPNAYNRMIQMYQHMEYLNNRNIAEPSLVGQMMVGDMNDDYRHTQVQVYNSIPSGGDPLPVFLSFPLVNSDNENPSNPTKGFPIAPMDYYTGTMHVPFSKDGNPTPAANDEITVFGNGVPNPGLTLPMLMDYSAYAGVTFVDSQIINSNYIATMPDSTSTDASDHAAVKIRVRVP